MGIGRSEKPRCSGGPQGDSPNEFVSSGGITLFRPFSSLAHRPVPFLLLAWQTQRPFVSFLLLYPRTPASAVGGKKKKKQKELNELRIPGLIKFEAQTAAPKFLPVFLCSGTVL